MTLRESPPGAGLRVMGLFVPSVAASRSGPRARHTAGGLRPGHKAGHRRPVRHTDALPDRSTRRSGSRYLTSPARRWGKPRPVQHL